jgi:hypothetical protein
MGFGDKVALRGGEEGGSVKDAKCIYKPKKAVAFAPTMIIKAYVKHFISLMI